MKKITQFAACLFFIFSSAYGQKELWGYRMTPLGTPGSNNGVIIKTALAGDSSDPETMHEFDPNGMLGKFPRGRLFQASNGKLYGVTGYDGNTPGPGVPLGVLFEYDLILDQYKVLSTTLTGAMHGVIEPQPNILYGITNSGSSIFKYNINTEEMSIVATIPPFSYNSSNQYPKFTGELMKASDGNLYGVTSMAPSAQNIPYPGGIYRLNLSNNQLTKIHYFGAPGSGSDVIHTIYETKLVEALPGKLYGTALGGANIGPQGVAPLGSGTLFEYTIATNTMVKKFDFNYAVNGANPSPIIKSTDNKLYGTLGGNNNSSYPNPDGLVFEYDLSTETMSILRPFSYVTDDMVRAPYGTLLKASDGAIYGSSGQGNFKLNLTTNTVNRKIIANNTYEPKDLIEICRKPSYHFFDTASFVVCVNNPFVFDVQNTNATSYVWKKGSTILPSQTTGILSIPNLVVSDSGIYTCTMINSCGTTITMPLQLTVDGCLGTDELTWKNAIKLYPNPAANVLNIQLPNTPNFETKRILISNMLGQTVYNEVYKNPSVEISFLATGMYQLHLITDKGDWKGKFVKE